MHPGWILRFCLNGRSGSWLFFGRFVLRILRGLDAGTDAIFSDDFDFAMGVLSLPLKMANPVPVDGQWRIRWHLGRI